MGSTRINGRSNVGVDQSYDAASQAAHAQHQTHTIGSIGARAIKNLRQGFNLISKDVRAVADSFAGSIEKKFSGSGKDNAKTLLSRLPRLESDASKQIRLANLLGKTFEPKAASQLLNQFQFDHTGKLLAAKGSLNSGNLNKLEQSVLTRALSQTNSGAERTAARTEREILLDIATALKNARKNANPELGAKIDGALADVKNQWLNLSQGTPRSATTNPASDLLNKIAKDLNDQAPEIAKYALSLVPEALKQKTVTQAYDNTFGRKFESEFVFALAKNPPDSIKNAAAITGKWLFDQAVKLPATAQEGFIKNLADNLSHDPRPWHTETPSVGKFLAKPDINTLKELLEPNTFNGFDVVKTSWVGVKAALSFPKGFQPEFRAQADDNYGRVVILARSQTLTTASGGLKLQTDAANHIIGDINRLFSGRARIPGNASIAQAQQDYVRALLDPISYSVRTPRELSQKLYEFSQNLRSIGDLEVADILLSHAYYSAANPNPDVEYDVIEVQGDDVDKRRLAAQGQEFKSLQTTGYGTTLPHQRVNVGGEDWGSGLSVQGKTTLNTSQIKGFDKQALENEMNSVNGPSGSTNIMTFMYLQIQKENPSLNLEDAFAGTMTFLTLDGGHSLPESVGTFTAITSDTRTTINNNLPSAEAAQIAAKRANILENFKLDYGNLAKVFSNPQTSAAVSNSVEAAWDKTLNAFSEIHQERIKIH